MTENELSKIIIGAAIKVHKALGPGLLESAYEVCLMKELLDLDLQVLKQVSVPIVYKGEKLVKYYRPDYYVYDGIIVELKAIKQIGDWEFAQILNYLKGTEKRVGYLLNFGASVELEWKRFIK